MMMIKLVKKVFLESSAGIASIYIPTPGGRGSRCVHLDTHDMRILAHELLAHAERIDAQAERIDAAKKSGS